MEARESFTSAAYGFVDLLGRVPAAAWDGPGLGVWDLRALVGHTSRSLTTVETYLDRPAPEIAVSTPEGYYHLLAIERPDPAAVVERGRQAGAVLGSDPCGFVEALLRRVLARLATTADPVIETAAGGMHLSRYLPTRTFELVVHSCDIADATGVAPPALPLDVLSEVVQLAARIAVLRGSGTDLLLSVTGRRALPPRFTVV